MEQNIYDPTLLLNQEKMVRNLQKMTEKAAASGVVFRPHMKTHQSAEIGQKFKAHGVRAITVSNFGMAEQFADAGWDDITVAFPVNIRRIDTINRLADRISLHLLIESEEVLSFLKKEVRAGVHKRGAGQVGIWIKIDTGYGRTGIPAHEIETINRLASSVENTGNQLRFEGLLTHAGHTYHARTREEVLSINHDSIARLLELKRELLKRGLRKVLLSVGDTPSCSIADDFHNVDEIRPGNFIFYDATQWTIGSCRFEEIAVAVACPVVAKHSERNEIVIHGGAVHLSKEALTLRNGNGCGRVVYGFIAEKGHSGSLQWGGVIEDAYVSALSQEHGIIKAPLKYFEETSIGDLVYVIPVHSCLTVNLLGGFLTTEGKKISLRHLKKSPF